MRPAARRARPGQRVGLGLSDLARERLAVNQRAQPLIGGLSAVLSRDPPILGGQQALLGELGAQLSGPLALPRGGPGEGRVLRRVVEARFDGIGLGQSRIACIGRLVSRQRGDIAGRRDRIARLRRAQTRAGSLLAVKGGFCALARRSLADVLGELVRIGIDPMGEVAVAGGLIAVGGQLVAVRVRLVAVGAGLIGVGERLVAVGERLVAVERV